MSELAICVQFIFIFQLTENGTTLDTTAECDFFRKGDGNYECVVTFLTITEPGTKVSQFKSDILSLRKLVIRGQDIHFFPKGDPKLFPNLQELEISNCKLKIIEADDLEGYTSIITT